MISILKLHLGNKNAFTCTLCKNVITDLESQITDPSNEQQVSILLSCKKVYKYYIIIPNFVCIFFNRSLIFWREFVTLY